MRRGWIVLSVVVVLLLTGCFSWWWSTPGQLWWMTKKWEWWVWPQGDDAPGGLTPDMAAYRLEPQWSRLLGRQVVTPYLRTWASPADQRLKIFFDRISTEIHNPWPSPLSGYCDVVHRKNGKEVRPGTEGATSVLIAELLLPPDQHAVFTRIAREVLGDEGQPSAAEIPPWWLPSL